MTYIMIVKVTITNRKKTALFGFLEQISNINFKNFSKKEEPRAKQTSGS